MNPLPLILGLPLASAAMLAFVSDHRLGGWVNAAASFATLFVSLILLVVAPPEATQLVFVDDLNVHQVILTCFVAFTAAWFSAVYVPREVDDGRLAPGQLRFYHALYQLLVFAMLAALLASNIVVMWAAIQLATLVAVLLIGLSRSRPALEAAWKSFILGSVGTALALFGTILFYLAAQKAMGPGMEALTWPAMLGEAPNFEPELLDLAFVFILVGYGTAAGLVPLHAWLPDAHAEAPSPVSAVLSSLLINIGLCAILRFKMLMSANGDTVSSGPLLIALGLVSLIVAGLMLYRRRDIKRLLAYSSIGHMGLAAFAFGMGGPLGNFAGLLHMVMHALAKSAAFYAVGLAVQAKGTRQIAEIGGLTASHPALGWVLVACAAALAGLPPFGLFMSEFVLVTSTFSKLPTLGVLLSIGLLVSFGGIMLRLQGVAFGSGEPGSRLSPAALLPVHVHLLAILVASLLVPGVLVAWFQGVAEILG